MDIKILYNNLENLEYPVQISRKFESTGKLDGKIELHILDQPPLRMVVQIKKLRYLQLVKLIERKQQLIVIY